MLFHRSLFIVQMYRHCSLDIWGRRKPETGLLCWISSEINLLFSVTSITQFSRNSSKLLVYYNFRTFFLNKALKTPYRGSTLGISIHGFTILLGWDLMWNFMGSSVGLFLSKDSEIHGFTWTKGTRLNAAPVIHSKSNNTHTFILIIIIPLSRK